MQLELHQKLHFSASTPVCPFEVAVNALKAATDSLF